MRRVLRWVLAVATVAAAELATRMAVPIVDTYPVSFFVVAVLLCAWQGGFWIGGFATIASTLLIASQFLATEPVGIVTPGEWVRLALFVTSALGISVVCAQLRRAAARERRHATDLRDREAVLRRETLVRERTEVLLEEERVRLAGIIGSAMDAIITTDEDQRVVLFNRAAEHLFRVPRDEAIGSDLDRFIPERYRGAHRGHVANFGTTGVSTRTMGAHASVVMARRADGSEFPIEAAISQVTTRGGRYFTVILRDVTERQRQELEREGLIAQLQAASEAKSRFLATMSHELRTPLNAILGYAELLEMGIAGAVSKEQREYLHRVSTSGIHLRRLIDEVLDLAKVEAGQMSVRRERADLVTAVESSLALVRPQAESRALRVETLTECRGGLPYLGDEDRVRQILLNILSNAVKFTPEGGRISIACGRRRTRRGEDVFVEVTDTGPGIPEHHQQRIFEPFVQVSEGTNAYTRTQGGTGLGLAISRQLARLMGGDVEVRSHPGEGAAFTLWIPAATREARGASGNGGGDSRRGHAELGRRLAERAPEIVGRLTARLRADPYLAVAREAQAPDLEDHIATFIADFAQQLVILDTPRLEDRAGMIRDGSEFQALMARRHGAQRRRLGWDERALRREFAILRDEILSAIEEAASGLDGVRGDRTPLIRAFLREAANASIVGYRAAGEPAARSGDREVQRVPEQEGVQRGNGEGHPRGERAGGLHPTVEP